MDRRARRLSLTGAVLVLAGAGVGGCTGGDGTAKTADPPPPVLIDKSLVWASTQGALLDDPSAVGLARAMAAFSGDGHGGTLLATWFDTFATTAHSQRYGPLLLSSSWHTQFGADPSQWDLDALPFTVTGVHNRIDLLSRDAVAGHCGEFRVSLASTDPTYQPLHVIFLLRQPLGDGDIDDGVVTCRGSARRWAELSVLDGAEFAAAARAILDEALVPERALLAESVEQTVSPWEWRQWQLAGTPANPPLFQTVDIPRLNLPGAEHDGFVAWVDANAPALDARTLAIPEAYRSASARVADGIPRETLDLTGVSAGALAAHPDLRKNIEIMGCPVCHTADADFVQTKPDRTFSPFYEAELDARKVFLDSLAGGADPVAAFAPLQPDPVLPD